MSHKSDQLRTRIAEEVRQRGPITFERFMERALYEPGLGYYATAGAQRGPGIDYRTSPQVGPVFALLLAEQIEECHQRLGSGMPFAVVEYGAGGLELARGISEALVKRGVWTESCRYLCVDPYAPHNDPEAAVGTPVEPKQVPQPGPVRVPEEAALEALGRGTAVLLSNEFVDALPVRRLVMRRGELREICVGLQDERGVGQDGPPPCAFIDIERPLAAKDTASLPKATLDLPEGFRLEWSQRASAWMERAGGALRRGYVVTLDYGYRRAERFRPERADGTLLAYYQHRVARDLYARVGDQDLTSHVDFDGLMESGAKRGLVCLGLTDQMRFLTALAKRIGLLEGEPASAIGWRQRLAFKELIRPGGMGTTFRVLIQATSTELGPLSGLEDPFAS